MVSSSGNERPTDEPTIPRTSASEQLNEEAIVLDETHRIEKSESDSSITAKARESAKALKDLVTALANKSKETAVIKTQEFKHAANDERPEFEADAADIQRLGSLVDKVAESFDSAMDDIARTPYEEQTHLFQGFKKLLMEEINVVNARLSMASRLAPSDKAANSTEVV